MGDRQLLGIFNPYHEEGDKLSWENTGEESWGLQALSSVLQKEHHVHNSPQRGCGTETAEANLAVDTRKVGGTHCSQLPLSKHADLHASSPQKAQIFLLYNQLYSHRQEHSVLRRWTRQEVQPQTGFHMAIHSRGHCYLWLSPVLVFMQDLSP